MVLYASFFYISIKLTMKMFIYPGFGTSQYTEISNSSKKPKLDEPERHNKDPFSYEQGLSDKNSTNIQTPKPKKFFKSRNVQPLDEVQSDSKQCSEKVNYSYGAGGKKPKASYGGAKKFFQSKQRSPSPNKSPPKRDESKPPIVLRICRGKSRLLSDSDESESTPTPSSAPSSSTITSPRTTRDSQPTRITRSTRRSMQLDPGSSPVTAETPTETFACLLSPEYIPPEKFELERKAMYDNLLGPSSPVNSRVVSTSQEGDSSFEISEPSSQELELEETQSDNPPFGSQQTESSLAATSGIFTDEIETISQPMEETIKEPEPVPEPVDTSESTKIEDQNKLEEAHELLKSTNVDFSLVTSIPHDIPKKPEIVEDSVSESDSESSQIPTNPTESEQNVFEVNTIDKHKEAIMEKILEKPIDAPAVKLVISKKKGSIFKSRAMVPEGSKKRRALYKHKWCDDKEAQVYLFLII